MTFQLRQFAHHAFKNEETIIQFVNIILNFYNINVVLINQKVVKMPSWKNGITMKDIETLT